MRHTIDQESADFGSFSALLPSWSNSVSLLHPTNRAYPGVMGAHYLEFDRTCGYVLVLLPSRERHSDLVEGMDHETPNRTICC